MSNGRLQVKLSYDQFGNFVVQKLLETGDSQDHSEILKQVKGHAPQLQGSGTRPFSPFSAWPSVWTLDDLQGTTLLKRQQSPNHWAYPVVI